jgi:hypothetical protein
LNEKIFHFFRLMFHAANTKEQVEALANTICSWTEQNIYNEEEVDGKGQILKATQQVYAWMAAAAA